MLSFWGLIQPWMSANSKNFQMFVQGALVYLASLDPLENLNLPLAILLQLGLVKDVAVQSVPSPTILT